MCRNGRTRDSGHRAANLVGILFDAELLDAGNAVVEPALVPEAILGTADATVARLDGEGHAAVPAHGGTGVVGGGAFAAHLVQAVAFARGIVIPLFDELTRIEVRTTIAFVVDALAVEHLRSALAIQFRDAVEGQHVSHHGGHHLSDGRATRYFDDGFVGDDFVYRCGTRRVRLGCLHATPGSACAPRDDGFRIRGGFFQHLNKGASAVDAEHAVFIQRRIAFHRKNEITFVFFSDIGDDFFGLMSGCGHQRIVVVQREHGQHHVFCQRVRGADERFRTAGAFQTVQPDHRRARFGFHCMSDLWCKRWRQPK